MDQESFRTAMVETMGNLILQLDSNCVKANLGMALMLNGADANFSDQFMKEVATHAFQMVEFMRQREGVELTEDAEEARQKCSEALGIELDD